ncbi:transposase [Paludibaculum fermentans]|uniref:transposase n=1 Tax=Paludibaculum fermentans TaxID=1473598 RepID=UPI0038990483
MVVLLTWSGYGLHPTIHKSESLVRWRQQNAKSRPYVLERPHRKLILETICNACKTWNWALLAAHIRSTHLHVILDTSATPERSMGELKRACTNALKEANLATWGDRIWADYGHIRPLGSPYAINKAINYVLNGQGAPMEIHHGESGCESCAEATPPLHRRP